MESPNPTRQRTPHGPRPRVSSSFPAPSPAVQSSFFRRPSDGPWTPLVAIAPSSELGTDRFPLTGTVSSKEWCRDWTLRRIIAAGVARWSGIMNPIDLYTTLTPAEGGCMSYLEDEAGLAFTLGLRFSRAPFVQLWALLCRLGRPQTYLVVERSS